MANSSSAAKSAKDDVQQLSEQIGILRKDIAEISDTLASLGAHSKEAAAANVKTSVARLQQRGEAGLEMAQSAAEDLGNQAADAVRSQPAAAVGLAIGLGFLLGFVSGRR